MAMNSPKENPSVYESALHQGEIIEKGGNIYPAPSRIFAAPYADKTNCKTYLISEFEEKHGVNIEVKHHATVITHPTLGTAELSFASGDKWIAMFTYGRGKTRKLKLTNDLDSTIQLTLKALSEISRLTQEHFHEPARAIVIQKHKEAFAIRLRRFYILVGLSTLASSTMAAYIVDYANTVTNPNYSEYKGPDLTEGEAKVAIDEKYSSTYVVDCASEESLNALYFQFTDGYKGVQTTRVIKDSEGFYATGQRVCENLGTGVWQYN